MVLHRRDFKGGQLAFNAIRPLHLQGRVIVTGRGNSDESHWEPINDRKLKFGMTPPHISCLYVICKFDTAQQVHNYYKEWERRYTMNKG